MITHTVRLLEADICEGAVGRFRFSRPEGYDFVAGQHFTLSLTGPDAIERRILTISSAPQDDFLEICTRLSDSAFKQALAALSVTESAEISAASGRLHLAEKGRSTGFLVGGVGVTPAHSMVRDAMLRQGGEPILLFYGDRGPACMTYAAEFADWASRSEQLTYVPVVEHPDDGWSGEQGFITADLVDRIVADPREVDWIVSGPPPMVDAMRRVADALAIPDERMQVEAFTGYAAPGAD